MPATKRATPIKNAKMYFISTPPNTIFILLVEIYRSVVTMTMSCAERYMPSASRRLTDLIGAIVRCKHA